MVIYNGISADGIFVKSRSINAARAKAYEFALKSLSEMKFGGVGWQAIKKMPDYEKVGEVYWRKDPKNRYEPVIQWHVVIDGYLYATELFRDGSLGKRLYKERV